jgi:hypothetical protein
MNVHLLYPAADFDWQAPAPWGAEALIQDLGLQTLFAAMANGDNFLLEVARKIVLSPVTDPGIIGYRQNILSDCLANVTGVRAIYDLTVEAIEKERTDYWRLTTKYPHLNLSRAIDVLGMFVIMLARLRDTAEALSSTFRSEGFTTLFAMLKRDLSEEYLASLRAHLKRLRFPDGVLLSAGLGKGLRGVNYSLREAQETQPGWINRIFGKRPPEYTFHLHPRDESGFAALSELKDRGINTAANIVAQSSDHVLSFLQLLRNELAFYLGCLNLHEHLARKGEPTCFPVAVSPGVNEHTARGLYDVCLALSQDAPVVGNDLDAAEKMLVIITGANQGGKSTFVRSIGLAQLMMQCGMFVPAQSFSADLRGGIVTHFKREEDATMQSGKLDEELSRMSHIVDQLGDHAMILFNESFAATNDREGSELARQITTALLEKGVKIFYVTHLYEFARGFFDKGMREAIFLRAERRPDGSRTFKLVESEPLETSHGEDLYRRIFAMGPGGRKPESEKANESDGKPFIQ